MIKMQFKTIFVILFIIYLNVNNLYSKSNNNFSALYYQVDFYGNYFPFINQNNQIIDIPTLVDIENSDLYNSHVLDSLATSYRKIENEEEKNRLGFLNSLDSFYFINKKWGYPMEFFQSYTLPDSLTTTPTLVYSIKQNIELNDFLFCKKIDKIMLLEEINCKYDRFDQNINYYKFKLKKSALYVNINGRYTLLFDRKKKKSGIKNYYGRFFYNQHYTTISFLNHNFSDIYEFYLIDIKSPQKEIYLLWFDNDYNLVRKENINIGIINEGVLIINL